MSVIVSKPRALVTGGMGFIGSHIVDRLVEELFEVHCIDDKSAECNEKFYENDDVTYYKADISSFEDVSKIFLKVKMLVFSTETIFGYSSKMRKIL